MNSWASLFNLGLVHPAAFPEAAGDRDVFLRTIRKIVEDPFFGAIEITQIREDKVRNEVASLLNTGGQEVVYLAAVPILLQQLNLSSPSDIERSKAVSGLKPLIDEAYSIGARLFLVGSGPDPGRSSRENAKRQLVKSLNELCAYARELAEEPLVITLENYDRDIDKRFLLGPTSEAVEVAKRVLEKHPNFGLTIDQSHLYQLGEDPACVLPQAIDVIVHVHLANCALDRSLPWFGDQHPRFGVPGSKVGAKEVTSFLSILMQAGYFEKAHSTTLPVISLEVKPYEKEESDAVVANAKRVFLQAWAELSIKQSRNHWQKDEFEEGISLARRE